MNFRQRYHAGVSKLKRLIEFIAYGLFDVVVLFFSPPAPRANGLTAIVHTKLMGDYFLWLPYGLALTEQLRKTRGEVIFLCNDKWENLALCHFSRSRVIGVNTTSLKRSITYRARTLRSLRKLGVSATFNSGYPRDFPVEDACTNALGGRTMGFDATYPDRPWLDRTLSRLLYDQLILHMPHVHQATRYVAFLEFVGIPNSSVLPFAATFTETEMECNLEGDTYFVVSPGASHSRKTWPAEHFLEIAKRILATKPDWRCILIGSPAEQAWIDDMQRVLGSRATSLAGRISLTQMVAGVRHATLVVGNDSAAGHIAAAWGTPCVITLPGAEFGRCQPYDENHNSVAKVPATAFHKMDCYGCEWNCRYRIKSGRPAPCVERITIDAVWAQIATVLRDADASLKHRYQCPQRHP